MSKRLGILLSGRGSNFVAIADAIAVGKLDAEIAVVISNREHAPGLQIARERKIPAFWHKAEADVLAELKRHHIDLVCLAGYMRILSVGFVSQFSNCLLNIHPSLLPSFPGLDVQQKAIAHGVKFSGCTVHIVDGEGVDTGPIVKQAVVPVLGDDTAETLAARILKEEHRIYPEAIALLLSGKFRIDGRRVVEE
jgi:phosphoribosylglycinamide formyltransferase-1